MKRGRQMPVVAQEETEADLQIGAAGGRVRFEVATPTGEEFRGLVFNLTPDRACELAARLVAAAEAARRTTS